MLTQHDPSPSCKFVLCAALSFLLGAILGCSSSSKAAGPGSNISGNWYATDPSTVQSASNPLSGIGIDLADQNGTVTGNVTPYLFDFDNGACSNLAYNLAATGTIDGLNHLTLTASDGTVSFSMSATISSDGSSFSNASYKLSGIEVYPAAIPVLNHDTGRAAASHAQHCDSYSGVLNGKLLPVSGEYSGTLTATNGATVAASISLQPTSLPYGVTSAVSPAFIPQGHEQIWPGGFALSGTMTLTNSVCGATTATIQAQEGYVYGNYLLAEFDTDATYKTGAAFLFKVDPATGSLILLPDTSLEYNKGTCEIRYSSGSLTRQQ